MLEITFTGTGNAGQVPVWGCDCAACERASRNPRFRRQPCSLEIRTASGVTLIDVGRTDIAARYEFAEIEQIVLTHFHMDHVQGLFHLRWSNAGKLSVYCPPDPMGADDLFKHPGALDFKPFDALFERIELRDFAITPLLMNHSKLTYGYLIEYHQNETEKQNIAYLTDTVGLPEQTLEYLSGFDLNYLILDCTSPPRSTPPRNHNDLNLAQSIIEQLSPQQALLTHISHEMDMWLIENPEKVQGFGVAHDQMKLVLS